MKKLKTTILILFFLITIPIQAEVDHYFIKYIDRDFNYTIKIPRKWRKHKVNLGYKNILYVSQNQFTNIKITATVFDDEEKKKWDEWQYWYLDKFGSRISNILEKKEIIIQNKIKGQILVFEYTYRNRQMLQRILFANFEDNLLIIECRSTIDRFYNLSDMFNTIMSSLDIKGI